MLLAGKCAFLPVAEILILYLFGNVVLTKKLVRNRCVKQPNLHRPIANKVKNLIIVHCYSTDTLQAEKVLLQVLKW